MTRPAFADEPGPGQESVWDYPRPPAVEPVGEEVVVVLGGVEIVRTSTALRVLETSHPPVYYVPADAVLAGVLAGTERQSWCEFKGMASYVTVTAGGRREVDAGWTYPAPTRGYARLAGHVAFYPARMDSCSVGGEVVSAQEGDFYGGWRTARVVGPFKGGPGTLGW